MNEHIRRAPLPPLSPAIEALMQRRWTVAEIVAMVEAGSLLEDERFELIGGEVVPMSPKGSRHEVVKQALQKFWFRRCPPEVELITETTLYVSADEFLEPDFLFWPSTVPLKEITPSNTLLVVEAADTSLGYDLGRKAGIYARIGLRELWVVDAKKLVTTIHRGPTATGYAEKHDRGRRELLVPTFAPELAVRLGQLGIA